MGSLFKGVGLALGIIAVLGAIGVSSDVSSSLAFGLGIVGIAMGGILIAIGTLLTAAGAALRAVLDTAVNTSPLLDLTEIRALLDETGTQFGFGKARELGEEGNPPCDEGSLGKVAIPEHFCYHCGEALEGDLQQCPHCNKVL